MAAQEAKNTSASSVRACQNCKNQFTIEPEDFDFYKKIDVPPPTWCVTCRMQRRMSWGADSTTLYRRVCQAPGHAEHIFSVYPEETKSPVYDPAFWASDGWDALSYGKAYDFSRSFFEQFKELLDVVPVRSTEVINSINSDYCLGVTDSKNCYLCSGTFGSENCLYGNTAVFSKDCVDVMLSTAVDQGYGLFSVDKSFHVTNSTYSDELVNCDFMYDCRGCSDCLGCVGLRNKKYCIFNVQYYKSDYKKERAKYDLGSYAVRQEVAKQFNELLARYPRKFAVIRNASHSTGDNLINTKNCTFVFQALNDIENCKYSFVVGYGTKDSQDIAGAGLKSQLLYDVLSIVSSSDVAFSYRIRNSSDVRYSRECFDSEHLFGCVGLKSKKYCVLNKQYSKEEYHGLIKRIREQMMQLPYVDQKGRVYHYGEFMPSELSLFPYTSSWGKDYFPETKNTAEQKGLWWLPQRERHHEITLTHANIPDHVNNAPLSITDQVIECAGKANGVIGCIGVFKITPKELSFYKENVIALPRTCPVCRFHDRLKNLTPYKLWLRRCECFGLEQRTGYRNSGKHEHGEQQCPNTFQTGYAPGRPELLYCEACYNAEIL